MYVDEEVGQVGILGPVRVSDWLRVGLVFVRESPDIECHLGDRVLALLWQDTREIAGMQNGACQTSPGLGAYFCILRLDRGEE